MAWELVDVAHGQKKFMGMLRGDELQVSSAIGTPKTVRIHGETFNVLEVVPNDRDPVVNLILDGVLVEEEESDDQPDEGGDDD